MNAQVNILLLTEILGIPVILIIFAVFLFLFASKKDKAQKWAHEKVMGLTRKGHDAKVCPKCNGKAAAGEFWAKCAECGGLGYIYKLREHEETAPNADEKGELQECANCGAMIGKLEKSYVFEYNVVCGECFHRLNKE